MSRNILGMIRAMLNDNGRTDDEAKAFHAKAAEWTDKYNLHHIFGEEIKAKASKPKGKAKNAKASFKPVDNRLRAVLVKNAQTGRWSTLKTVSKADFKATMKGLREGGYTVKSKVVK
jgi:hypothetical protein